MNKLLVFLSTTYSSLLGDGCRVMVVGWRVEGGGWGRMHVIIILWVLFWVKFNHLINA